MLRYNTQLKQLVLPEYGRNIQAMVDHCLTIEDRQERTRCAHAIVKAMSVIVPGSRENEESRRKLWDHLAVMSDFKLDIDWPFEPVEQENLVSHPEKIPYPASHIRLRHYGRSVERAITKAAAMEPGPERDELISMLANQMKKLVTVQNKDTASDGRVFKDLAEYSHGEIRLDPEHDRLHEFQIVAPPTGKKKRKK